MLRIEEIVTRLQGDKLEDALAIVPTPNVDNLIRSGSAAIDLRLGCWFTTLRKSSVFILSANVDVSADKCDEIFIPFGKDYILHPGDFVLAVTLEWVSIPCDLAGYIHGKSSWGRRGLIIATASVIHPGFKGCITLELTNLGEVPISIKPGMLISQLCLHHASIMGEYTGDVSTYSGKRKPTIGNVKIDSVAHRLMEPLRVQDEAYGNNQTHLIPQQG